MLFLCSGLHAGHGGQIGKYSSHDLCLHMFGSLDKWPGNWYRNGTHKCDEYYLIKVYGTIVCIADLSRTGSKEGVDNIRERKLKSKNSATSGKMAYLK